jgi:hypothetical protein
MMEQHYIIIQERQIKLRRSEEEKKMEKARKESPFAILKDTVAVKGNKIRVKSVTTSLGEQMENRRKSYSDCKFKKLEKILSLQRKFTKGKEFNKKRRLKEVMKFRIYNQKITTKLKMHSGIESIFHSRYVAKLFVIKKEVITKNTRN